MKLYTTHLTETSINCDTGEAIYRTAPVTLSVGDVLETSEDKTVEVCAIQHIKAQDDFIPVDKTVFVLWVKEGRNMGIFVVGEDDMQSILEDHIALAKAEGRWKGR